MLTLKALGTLDFLDDSCASVPVLLTQPKRAALLAYLVIAPTGTYCRRDTLLGLFWPELDEEHGRSALSQALSFLRSHLPEGVLVGRGQGELGVDAAKVRSDVAAFRSALEAGQWAEAVVLYRGELLEGLHVAEAAPFVDWVDRERTRLREAAAGAAWARAHQLIGEGHLVEAERMAQRALSLVPTDESPVREFIPALAQAGDRGAALRFYEKFKGMLASELEVDPAPETEAVAAAVRRGAGHAPAPKRAEAPDSPEPSPAPAARAPAAAAASPPSASGAETTSRRGRSGVLVAAAALTLAAVAVLLPSALRRAPLQVTAMDMVPLTHDAGVEFLPSLSPDGSTVAFVVRGPLGHRLASGRVEIAPASGVETGRIQVAGASFTQAWDPVWAPDGQTVRFVGCGEDGACRWLESGWLGGAPRPAQLPPEAPASAYAQQMTWSPDWRALAYFRGDTLFVASEEGGTRVLMVVDSLSRRFGRRHSIAWSPDGERIAFVNGSRRWWGVGFDSDPSSIWVVEVEDGSAREIVGGDATSSSPVWLDERLLLFVSTLDGPRGLYVAEVGRDGLEGEPALVGGVADPHTISYSPATGRLVFSRLTAELTIRSYPLEAPEPVSLGGGEPVTGGSLTVFQHDISPDGRWIVYEANHLGNADLYKMPLPQGDPVRLTDTPQDEVGPFWSPDGREITFTGSMAPPAPSEWEVFVMPSEGGAPVQVTRSPSTEAMSYWPTWSPDGLSLVYTSHRDGYAGWTVSRDSVGGAWREPVPLSPMAPSFAVWTADGDTLLFGDGGFIGRRLVALSRRGEPVWERNWAATSPLEAFPWNSQIKVSRSRATLYGRGLHKDGTVGIYAVPEMGRGEPRLVVRFDDPTLESGLLSVGPDRLYLTVSKVESDVWMATLKR